MSKKKPFEHEIDPELLAEIEAWEPQEHDEPEGYYFSNPDPYLKPTPLPPDHPRHNFWFDEDGHIRVKNPSAFWLPCNSVLSLLLMDDLLHLVFDLPELFHLRKERDRLEQEYKTGQAELSPIHAEVKKLCQKLRVDFMFK